MALSFTLFVLILAIAFFQATQGLFSALIMVLLTICCGAVAVGTHEYVAMTFLANKWRPDYAMAISLAVTFGVPLLILRAAMDNLIRRSCLLPSWVDRVGGGACGLLSAMILVGMIALTVQMIPFSGSFLGYARIEMPVREVREEGGEPTPPRVDRPDEELFLTPDRFAIALGGVLSDGLFSSQRSFSDEHIDYVQAMGWRNAVPSEVPRYSPPDSIKVIRHEVVPFVYWEEPKPRKDDPPNYKQLEPEAGKEFRMVRVELKKDAMGSAKKHLFTIRQFRLEGREEGSNRRNQYYPIGIQTARKGDSTNRHVRLTAYRNKDWPVIDEVFEPRDDNNGQVEIVYELPKGFKPDYLEFRRGARVALSFGPAGAGEPKGEDAGSKPEGTAVNATTTPDKNAADKPADSRTASSASDRASKGGRVKSFTAKKAEFGDNVPVKLTAYARLKNAEIERGKLANGHLVGYVDEQEGGKEAAVNKLDVPDDKQLLHLSTEFLKARSTFGGALSYAVKTMQNYLVQDENGNQYQLVGKYAEADVDGRRVFELQYFRDQSGSIGGVGAFDKIKEKHLEKDYTLVLLFLVDPGAKIVSFSTGGGDARKEDLRDENIVAPK